MCSAHRSSPTLSYYFFFLSHSFKESYKHSATNNFNIQHSFCPPEISSLYVQVQRFYFVAIQLALLRTLDPIQFRFSWFILLIQFIWYLFSEHSQWKFIIKVTPNISIQRVCDTKFLLASAHKLHFSFYFWFSVSRTQHSFICKYRKFYRVATHSK